jgi:hypothetical protein
MTPTECAHSLGRLGDDFRQENIEIIRSVGHTKACGCEQGHLGCMMVTCGTKEAHTLLSLEQLMETLVVFGKGKGNLGAYPKSGLIFPRQHGFTREVG